MDPRHNYGRAPSNEGHIPIPDLGDAHGRYSGYDNGEDDYKSQYQQAYDPQPFQATPQDIPLLHRSSGYDQFFDPNRSRPDLNHHRSSQSFQTQHDYDVEAGGEAPARPPVNDPALEGNFGHLIYDCPVPPKLLRNIPHTKPPGRDEFTHMRYTAATCDPELFSSENFTLRPQLFQKRRQTELFIVVTMYNEDDVLFARTMSGVFKNVEYMCSLKGKHNGLWGEDGWKKIVVCVVVDGRTKLDQRTQAVVTALGVYQHGVMVQEVNKKPVTAHIYEYTTKVGIAMRKGIVETKPGTGCPIQLIFCLKEENKKKINSHRWALQAFGGALQPNVVVLLDAGTRPGDRSIYELWKAFDLNPNCGGACGEIKAMLGKGKGWEKLMNPIIAAQNFEYKMSNILDKPMESAFGFISVLPGAFSAYRFIALQNDNKGKGPLEKYFDGEKHHLDADIFTKNMYLAEDRILCFELVAKRKSAWVLTYVCSATGETDVPEEMPELIKQRRRWLNGSFFAAVYALVHFYQIFRSSHSFLRKFMFMIEFLYQTVSMIFSWFAVGNFFLVFQILTTALGDPKLLNEGGKYASIAIEWVYLAGLIICFVLSLGNTPDGSRRFYLFMVWMWAAIMVYLMFASVYITIHSVREEAHDGIFTISKLFTNQIFFTLIVSLLSTYVLWIIISIIFMDPWHIVTSSIQYLLLSPTYTNVINVYAFCNTHDVTWGTKGDDKPDPLKKVTVTAGGKSTDEPDFNEHDLDTLYDKAIEQFSHELVEEPKKENAADKELNYNKAFRSYVVLAWMFCNAALVAVVLKAGGLHRLTDAAASEVAARDLHRMDGTTPAATPTAPKTTVGIYLSIILWSVAGLSAFKFVGAMWYKIHRIFVR